MFFFYIYIYFISQWKLKFPHLVKIIKRINKKLKRNGLFD